MAAVNYVLSPFEGNINLGDPTGIKLYLQTIKEIDKETEKRDISDSNDKDILDTFISLANKYDWERLEFMLNTVTGAKNTFRLVEHFLLEDINNQAHGYFYCKILVMKNNFFKTL